MPSKKRQTRRSISVRGLSYQRLQKLAQRLCERRDDMEAPSVSGTVEVLIAQACKLHGIPEETVLETKPRANTGPKGSTRHGGMFTW
jgi:hypothetical protein